MARDFFPIDLNTCSGEAVEILQRKLWSLGYYEGPCNPTPDPVHRTLLIDALHKFLNARKKKQALHRFADKSGASAFRNALADSICTYETWIALNEAAGKTFYEVLYDEMISLRGASSGTVTSSETELGVIKSVDVIHAAHTANLTGLAFSGGGIRSATFNLGILQALADMKLLRRFDYLSTVSGGGYIGGWLSKWICVSNHDVNQVQEQLSLSKNGESRCEPDAIKFLRQYSNYLTPKTGFFSADTWALLATYIRNTFLNLLIFTLVLAAALLLPRIWLTAVANLGTKNFLFPLVGTVAFLLAVTAIAMSISVIPSRTSERSQSQGWIISTVVLPLMTAAAAGSIGLWGHRATIMAPWNTFFDPQAGHRLERVLSDTGLPSNAASLALALTLPGMVYFLFWGCGWGIAQVLNRRRIAAINPIEAADSPKPIRYLSAAFGREVVGHFLCAVGALAVGTALIMLSAHMLDKAANAFNVVNHYSHLVTFGMPFLLIIFGLTMILLVGLVGRLYSDASREWWSRMGAWTIIFAWAWTGLFVFSLYGPAVMIWIVVQAPLWAKAIIAAGWLGPAFAGLWAAKKPTEGLSRPAPAMQWLAMLAPPLLFTAILCSVSTALFFLTAPDTAGANDLGGCTEYGEFLTILNCALSVSELTNIFPSLAALASCLVVGLLFAWRVDVNKFSLYMMYRNRLVRTYLGAISKRRRPHPFTGFDSKDDMRMHELDAETKMQRPHHIVNVALNMVKGSELAWQDRKAANFVFTSRYCGYETPRMPNANLTQTAEDSVRGMYRDIKEYGNESKDADEADRGVKLGMAMAISGAAVSPNMGYHSTPALSFLMALFNLRLGRWCGNPVHKSAWKKASPRLGFLYLFKELFGSTDANSKFLYLSDGGHFENLGIYELVRRRCRLIIVVDASADRQLSFGDLGNAIRKCYTDWNIEIDIKVSPIELLQGKTFSEAYAVAGKILYSRVDPPMEDGSPPCDGTILYIKPALLGSESADILNYAKTNPGFPHQGTGDQWFDETQFESYRSLGFYIAKEVLGDIAKAMQSNPDGDDYVTGLCSRIGKKMNIDKETQAVQTSIFSCPPYYGQHG